MNNIKTILTSKTLYGHLIITLLFIWLLIGLLLLVFLPLIYWLTYGEGASADYVYEQPMTKFIEMFAPLLCGLLIVYVGTLKNIRRCNLSKAKSYLMAGLSIILLYPFRTQVIDVIVNACQGL